MAGAGGYGDPLQRDPARVLDDVLDERISVEYARELHGVVVRDGIVNADATTAHRADLSRAHRTTDEEEDQ
jgi:N-methylhydantoinase B